MYSEEDVSKNKEAPKQREYFYEAITTQIPKPNITRKKTKQNFRLVLIEH